jgi:hypothetical protein
MEYQIILLPRKEYFTWVRACTDYVMAFGPNLTSDPDSAAKYMAPGQVITFPIIPGGFPEQGDIERWLQTNHAGIRLDPIEAGSPEELNSALKTRIEENDRYGQKQRPFYLLWPTEYAVITQAYGANPQIYGKWGFPGHEGIDFRARPNTNIFCCAEGEVYRVHKNPDDHPYGIHVRILHADGYRTVYGHLKKPLVVKGQAVEAGQAIGKADSTGASVGSHLHLTLKRDGATKRGETDYPKDVIDPTPYLVWPGAKVHAKHVGFEWLPGKCLIGAHGSVGGVLDDVDLKVIADARLEAVKLELGETRETIDKLRAINPAMFIMVRATSDFSQHRVPANNFISQVKDEIGRFYRQGIRYFEIHANPNLQSEGWGRSWRDGREFMDWFDKVVKALRKAYPDAKYGFPGVSPGGFLWGWRADAEQFIADAEDAIYGADWVGVNCCWTDVSSMNAPDGGRWYETYRLRFPNKLVFITEFQNPAANVGGGAKARQYLTFYETLRRRDGIGAAFAFAITAIEGHEGVVWRSKSGIVNEIPEILGGRSKTE